MQTYFKKFNQWFHFWLFSIIIMTKKTKKMDENLPISASTFDLYSALKKNLCFLLLGYSFKLRPKSCALGTTGSVMTISLSINGCSHSKNQFE